MKINHLIAAILLSLGCLLLIACPPTPPNNVVTINYEQLGACNGLSTGGGGASAGPNQAYVAFKVSTIVNTESAAQDFNFDPNKAYVNGTSPRAFVNNTSGVMPVLNPFLAKSRFVAKGTTETLNGSLIAVVSTGAADGASEANNTSYFLVYDTPAGGQGVSWVKKDPSRTSWPYTPDCTTIVY